MSGQQLVSRFFGDFYAGVLRDRWIQIDSDAEQHVLDQRPYAKEYDHHLQHLFGWLSLVLTMNVSDDCCSGWLNALLSLMHR